MTSWLYVCSVYAYGAGTFVAENVGRFVRWVVA